MFLDALAAELCSAAPAQQPETAEEGDDNLPPPGGSPPPPRRCVLVHDSPIASSSGSRSLIRHLLLRCLLSPSVDRVVVLSLLLPARHFQRLVDTAASPSHTPPLPGTAAAAKARLAILDAFSDLAIDGAHPSTAAGDPLPCAAHHELSNCLQLPTLSAAIERLARPPPSTSASSRSSPRAVVFVDGLSSLLLRHSSSAVLQWLLSLRSTPSLSLVVHADLAVPAQLSSTPRALAALGRLANCSLAVQEVRQEKVVGAAPHSPCRYHFAVQLEYRSRRSGRFHSRAEQWTLEPSSSLLSAPQDSDAAARSSPPVDAVSSALNALMAASPPSTTAPTPVSTFSLGVTEKQRAARAQLQLPYQHTGGRGVAVHFGEAGLSFASAQSAGSGEEDDVVDEDEDVDDDLDDV